MAITGGKLLPKSLSFLNPISLRSLSTTAAAGNLAANPAPPRAHRGPPPSDHFSVAQDLVDSCGLSKKDAEAVSPASARLRSPDKRDAVLGFLRDRGLTGDEIAAFVSCHPRVLRVKAESDFFAKFDYLVGLGFSAADVAAVLQKNNFIRDVDFVKKRVEFLRSILGKGADVTKLIRKSAWTLTFPDHMERRMVDNINKLGEWGVPSERIKYLIATQPRFFQLKPEIIDDAASTAEGEFGISRRSNIFIRAVIVLCSIPESARQSKFEVFESFGWKKPDIIALFRNSPSSLSLGVDNLRKNLDFFMNKVGLTAAFISRCGGILGRSFERRVLPRYELLCALKAKNIPSKKLTSSIYTVLCLPEIDFQSRFVGEFMELDPDACQVYMSSIK